MAAVVAFRAWVDRPFLWVLAWDLRALEGMGQELGACLVLDGPWMEPSLVAVAVEAGQVGILALPVDQVGRLVCLAVDIPCQGPLELMGWVEGPDWAWVAPYRGLERIAFEVGNSFVALLQKWFAVDLPFPRVGSLVACLGLGVRPWLDSASKVDHSCLGASNVERHPCSRAGRNDLELPGSFEVHVADKMELGPAFPVRFQVLMSHSAVGPEDCGLGID